MSAQKQPMYFDFLPKYENVLAEELGLTPASEAIYDGLYADLEKIRRRYSKKKCMEYRAAGSSIRVIAEEAVITQLKKADAANGRKVTRYSRSDFNLSKGIQRLYDEGQIDEDLLNAYTEVRECSNRFHHPNPVDENSLVGLLIAFDWLLRLHLRKMLGNKWCFSEVNRTAGNSARLLKAYDNELEEKARKADQLSKNNTELLQKAREANERANVAEKNYQEATDSLSQKVEEVERLRAERQAADQETEKIQLEYDGRLRQAQQEREELERKLTEKEALLQEALRNTETVNQEVDKILSEADFIRKILGGRGNATTEQQDLVYYTMDEPERAQRQGREQRRIVNVQGGAGTGKTLCLLAAIMNYLEPGGQQTLLSGNQRQALYLCFNKDLAAYVRGLLQGLPDLADRIRVESYDVFLNQLVICDVKDEYAYLADYATDVRYVREARMPYYWGLIYDQVPQPEYFKNGMRNPGSWTIGELVEEAMQEAGKRHVEYLQNPSLRRLVDTSNRHDVRWMTDEIIWMDNRYADDAEGTARYMQDDRQGRGTDRRVTKGSAQRKAILEVWTAYHRLLLSKQTYTVAQTITRLLSSNSLPQYDIVAVDEAQDLSLRLMKLVLRFMKDDGYLFVAGDEEQKVYTRDFTWAGIESELHYTHATRRLTKNMRNAAAIQELTDKLDAFIAGAATPQSLGVADKDVASVWWVDDYQTIVDWILERVDFDESTLIVTNGKDRKSLIASLKGRGYEVREGVADHMPNGTVDPGLYVFNPLKVKGLEFDTVVVDYRHKLFSDDPERERRTRRMQFTRARNRLFVLCSREIDQF